MHHLPVPIPNLAQPDPTSVQANALALSALYIEGLSICDILRRSYGETIGRELYRRKRKSPELGHYPYPVLCAVIGYSTH